MLLLKHFLNLVALLLVTALVGCTQPTQSDPIDLLALESEQAAQRFYHCQSEATTLDTNAQHQQSEAQFALAANRLMDCVALAPNHLEPVQPMRLHALAIVDYIRAGDLLAAQRGLATFKQAYPRRDLYFDEAYSFIDTLDVLLSVDDGTNGHRLLNARKQTLQETGRRDYWNQY